MVKGLVIRGEENYYICDVCGMKKPVSQMAGKCSVCGKYVCSNCAEVITDEETGKTKIYCEAHKPQEEKSGGCFIATAAYGSPLAYQLDVLRAFRDQKMLENKTGKLMVFTYYKISPPLASVIAQKETLKKIVRRCIDPIVGFLKNRGF
jgi:methionyl-tRNA synthetase